MTCVAPSAIVGRPRVRVVAVSVSGTLEKAEAGPKHRSFGQGRACGGASAVDEGRDVSGAAVERKLCAVRRVPAVLGIRAVRTLSRKDEIEVGGGNGGGRSGMGTR